MEPNFQSSLTAPNDKDSNIRYAGARNAPPLVGEESRNAQAELSNDDFIRKMAFFLALCGYFNSLLGIQGANKCQRK